MEGKKMSLIPALLLSHVLCLCYLHYLIGEGQDMTSSFFFFFFKTKLQLPLSLLRLILGMVLFDLRDFPNSFRTQP